MRKETKKVVGAFIKGESATAARTSTDGTSLLLFGNRIAWKDDDGLHMTMCGRGTTTTRERLNGLTSMLNLPGFYQRDSTQYWGDQAISSDDVLFVTWERIDAERCADAALNG